MTFVFMVLMRRLWGWLRQPKAWVVLGIGLFIGFFGPFVIFRHANLLSAQFDLGNMDQVLWNTVHGRWFIMTDALNGLHHLRTAVHADYLLLIYTPLYALWPDPRVLVVGQVVAVAFGALPLFWLGRKYLTDRAAALIGLAYLTYPWTQSAMIFDVHAVVLAIPLFLWIFWAAAERRWWWYAMCTFLVLLGKEEIGVTVALLGIFVAFWRKPRWIGLTTVVAGLGWSALMLWYAIPSARQLPGHFALNYYSEFGGSMTQVVTGILRHPVSVAHQLFDRTGLLYQAHLLAPLGGLSVFGLPVLLIATPELVVNLLSANHNLQLFYFHYQSVIIPFVFVSAIFGLHWLQRIIKKLPRAVWWHMVIMAGLITVNLITVYRWSVLPGTRHHGDAIHPFITNEYAQYVQQIARSIPRSHAVATTNNIAPHFTQRDYEWAFPRQLDRADDIVILTGGHFDVETIDVVDQALRDVLRDPQWQLVTHYKNLYHLRRVSSSSTK